MIINGITYPLEIREHNSMNITMFIDTQNYGKYGYAVLYQGNNQGTTTEDNIEVNYKPAKKWQNLPKKLRRQVAFILLQMGYVEPLNYYNKKHMKG